MYRILSLVLLCIVIPIKAQLLDWAPEINYRSADNKLYWKNKKPYEGYWQQDVHYQIQAKLNDSAEFISGKMRLVYYNNSPDVLKEAYFHLYQNAVQPGSLVDELYNKNKVEHEFGQYESQNLGTRINTCKVNGKDVKFTVDYTVMKMQLPQPLPPGDSCVFEMNFETFFDRGSIRRRMKVYDHHGYKHFNGVHWYPRICVYDRKFTWETAQHMEHEFYGDFGVYDVELQLPEEYVTEATGILQNPEEVYPGDLRQKLDLSNFAGKPIDSQPSVITPKSGKYKSWKYHAENVHDFAWTSDPTYRIGEVEWKGIKCIALAQENNAGGWQPTAKFLAGVVATYSNDFGMYEYPKMVAADAADGMEYPMLTLDGGNFPGHRGLIAHEVGHNWFFGMLGSNETYRASLDEGFTQFLTAWSMKKLTGQNQRPSDVEYGTVYAGYLRDAIDGNDPSLNTHSDDFNNAIAHGGGYGHVYYKTATMLYNLEYVLGDSVFQNAMKHYVRKWKICHPYTEDFRNSITEYVKTDLNWFFDQWLETTKHVDYKIKRVSNKIGKNTIHIQRKGDMIMPVELLLTYEDGSKLEVVIPVSHYVKPGKAMAPLWTGWGTLRPDYKLELNNSIKLKNVQIDTSGRLADINRVNNTWKNRIKLRFDKENGPGNDIRGAYNLYARPDIWYSYMDGTRSGLKLSGDYAGRKHVFNAYAWAQTGGRLTKARNFAYWFDYRHQLRGKGEIVAGSRLISNVFIQNLGWEKQVAHGGRFSISFKSMKYEDPGYFYQKPQTGAALNAGYLPSQKIWSTGFNNTLNIGFKKNYAAWKHNGNWNLQLRSSLPWGDASYGYARFTWLNNVNLNKAVFKTRIFAQSGAGNNAPAESMIYAAGANPEEIQDNKIVRDWAAYTIGNQALNQQLGLGGGLNLRGFAGYSIPHLAGDTVRTFYRGNHGAAINAELDFTRILGRFSSFGMFSTELYLFGDAGIMAFDRNKSLYNSGILADAGAGIVLNVGSWYKLVPAKQRPAMRAVKPFSIRADFPLFVSAVPEGDENFKFRWTLSINRAF